MRAYCTAFARGVCVNLNDMCRGTRHLRVFLVFDNPYCGVGRTAGQVRASAFGGAGCLASKNVQLCMAVSRNAEQLYGAQAISPTRLLSRMRRLLEGFKTTNSKPELLSPVPAQASKRRGRRRDGRAACITLLQRLPNLRPSWSSHSLSAIPSSCRSARKTPAA